MSLLVNKKSAVLQATPHDIQMMLACQVQIGSKNLDKHMEKYIFKRRQDGVNIINLLRTWEKLMLAARVIVAIENPDDITAVSCVEYGHRAIIKFAHFTGARQFSGRFMPGSFTNQSQKNFCEPRLVIVSDPVADHQAVVEASYSNIPVIAFCDADSPLKYVDIAIPINLRSKQSLAIMFWLLTREVLRMKGTINRKTWDIKPDLFVHREEEENTAKVTKEKETEKSVHSVNTKEQTHRETSEAVVANEEDTKLFGKDESSAFFEQHN